MDVSIDARRTVSPPLPASFIGSPIIDVGIPGTASLFREPGMAAQDVGVKADAIRSTVAEFTPENVATLLHETAFELGAQRRWNCILGAGHVIVTSRLLLELRMYSLKSEWSPGGSRRLCRFVMGVCLLGRGGVRWRLVGRKVGRREGRNGG